jgi:aminomethyltransferase
LNDIHEDLDDDEALETQPLALDGWHRAKAGRMVEFAGYWMPVQFEGIMAEHLWTRENAGLFDVSHMGQLGVSGDGAAGALEALLPGDIAGLKPGRVRYSLLLDEDGGVLDDLMVTNTGKDFALVVNGATKWDDIGHLREHLPDEIGLTYYDEQALLALQGPKAEQALARLGLEPGGEDVVPLADLRFMQAGLYLWEGRRLGVSRTGYTGEDGFEISVSVDHVEALADALVAQPEVKPIGLGARDSLRLEAGLPLYGHDLTPDIDPVSAGLTFAIAKRRRAEGGFPGAERVLGLLEQGTNRVRVGLAIEGRMAAREGSEVFSGETPVGVVTSGGFSPTLQHPIAMAYIDAHLADTQAPLYIDMRGRKLVAHIVAMPFVPHRYRR